MDALSEMLRTIQLRSAVFLDAELTGAWAVRTPPPRDVADVMMPDAQRVIPYHLVMEGACWTQLDREEPVRLAAGDIVLFPHGDPHRLFSAPGAAAREITQRMLQRLLRRGQVTAVRLGGDGAEVRLICGFFACDTRLSDHLVEVLPRIITLASSDSGVAGMLPALMRQTRRDAGAGRMGASAMLCKVSELLFIDAVRLRLEAQAEAQPGWLAGLRDRHVNRALALIHGRPLHPWTLEELSSSAGLSRSAFGERFTRCMRIPPLRYLARWRMKLAAGALTASDRAIIEIASDFGYQSEAAFTRAFRRQFGAAPGHWRRARAEPGRARPSAWSMPTDR